MAFSIPALIKALVVDATGQASIGGSSNKLSAAASVGDLVVVEGCFGLGTSPTVTVTDSKSNSYTTYVRADKTTNNTPHSYIAYAVLTSALVSGTDYITVTFGSNVNYPIFHAYKTTPTAGTVTANGFNSGTGQSTSPSSGSVTTTGTDEILFGVVCTGNPQTLTAGTGWTISNHNSNTTKALDSEYRIESSTGTFTANGTITSADWAACVAAFKAAATTVTGAAALTGTGSLTSAGTRTRTGAADLMGAGTFTAAGAHIAYAAAALAGSGTLTTNGTRTRFGAASLAGAATLAATGNASIAGSADLAGVGTMTADGTRGQLGAAVLTATGTLSAAGGLLILGAATLTGTGAMAAAGARVWRNSNAAIGELVRGGRGEIAGPADGHIASPTVGVLS